MLKAKKDLSKPTVLEVKNTWSDFKDIALQRMGFIYGKILPKKS